jgi:hypothetical protein
MRMLIDHEKLLCMEETIVDKNGDYIKVIRSSDIIAYIEALERNKSLVVETKPIDKVSPAITGATSTNTITYKDNTNTKKPAKSKGVYAKANKLINDKTVSINDYRCKKCKCTKFTVNIVDKAHVGLYCAKCGKWYKWAGKDDKNKIKHIML